MSVSDPTVQQSYSCSLSLVKISKYSAAESVTVSGWTSKTTLMLLLLLIRYVNHNYYLMMKFENVFDIMSGC